MDVFSVIVILFLIAILLFCIFIWLAVKHLKIGDCAGIPKFDPSSVFTKSLTIPMIGKSISGTVSFNPNGTFVLDASGSVYSNNKFAYDEDNCQIIISLEQDLLDLIDKYKCSLSTEVKITKKGQLVVSGTILGVLPIQVFLDKK